MNTGKVKVNRIKNKRHAQKAHFRMRFDERAPVSYSRKIRDQLKEDIKTSRVIVLKHQSKRITCFLGKMEGEKYLVFYDKVRHCFVTIIFEKDFNEKQWKEIRELSDKAHSMNDYQKSILGDW